MVFKSKITILILSFIFLKINRMKTLKIKMVLDKNNHFVDKLKYVDVDKEDCSDYI